MPVLSTAEVGSWWEIVPTSDKGGIIAHLSLIRLRNIATGRFLDFSNTPSLIWKEEAQNLSVLIKNAEIKEST